MVSGFNMILSNTVQIKEMLPLSELLKPNSIIIDRNLHGEAKLLHYVEQTLAARGERLLLVETSGLPSG